MQDQIEGFPLQLGVSFVDSDAWDALGVIATFVGFHSSKNTKPGFGRVLRLIDV